MIRKDIGPASRKLSRYIKHNLSHRISEVTNNQVTHVQARVLRYLEWMNDDGVDVYQKNIEEFLSVSKSTASEIISNLENNEYISRVKLENDGRLRKIVLLDKGFQTSKAIGKTIEKFEEEMRHKLTEEELDTFINIIDKIIS